MALEVGSVLVVSGVGFDAEGLLAGLVDRRILLRSLAGLAEQAGEPTEA
jgi:hypothetical protein